MHSINRRPRRLGAPAAAIGGVLVLIVVLVVTGMHSNPPAGHRSAGTGSAPTHTTQTTAATHHHTGTPKPTSTTSTAPPTVSAPSSASAHSATYGVSPSSYTLTVAATTGDCWVQATDTANGSVLFSATLRPGQSHSVAATGPLTVVAGAPNAFSATIDGTAVALPVGFQAPFTLTFQSPAGSPGTGTTATGASG